MTKLPPCQAAFRGSKSTDIEVIGRYKPMESACHCSDARQRAPLLSHGLAIRAGGKDHGILVDKLDGTDPSPFHIGLTNRVDLMCMRKSRTFLALTIRLQSLRCLRV